MKIFWVAWALSGVSCFAEEPVPAGVVPPMALPSPVSWAPISGQEKAAIYQQFRAKLKEEERAFDREEKAARKALVRMQKERKKEWREKERRARKAYFEAHTRGPDRRRYVQDFVKRSKELDHQEKVEWTQLNREQREARLKLRMSQMDRTQKVNEALNRNQRPEI